VRDSLERGTRSHVLICELVLTGVAEANTQQAFVDILDNDVIKPLQILKVSEKDLVLVGNPVLIVGRRCVAEEIEG
jgi:hypothetical protein